MISLRSVTVRYAGAAVPALHDVTVEVAEGELILVVGPTGSGKSTLLGAINALVPHFTGGTLSGTVHIDGRSTADHRPRELADVVATVRQSPAASFVTDVVEDELAFGMETLGVPPAAMRRRVEETLDLLGLAALRRAPVRQLSGGEQQRVAIGAALAAGARVLVLDEPTSALDPVAAEDVLSTVSRLVHDLGMTVVLAEHRLERVVHHADGIVLLQDGTATEVLDPAAAMARSAIVPPVIELGRALGWEPLPLSVRAARRQAVPLRPALATYRPPDGLTASAGEPTARLTGVDVVRGPVTALHEIDLVLRPGTVTAIMGRNGSGKSTLLHTLAGQLRPRTGSVRVAGLDPARLPARDLVRQVGIVPQNPLDLLYAESVLAECRTADSEHDAPAGTTRALLDRVLPGVAEQAHPRDLSEGQQLALALATVLAGAPPLLLLDEPTRGLDYRTKHSLVLALRELAAQGRTVVVATHDVELAAEISDRVVLLGEGEVVADEPARELLTGSPAFAPQIARVAHPAPLLTVAEAVAAVTTSRAGHG